MKKLLIICFAALATAAIFTSCKESKGKVLDPLAKISIRAAANAQATASKAPYFSPTEIVRQTTDLVFQSHDYPNEPYCNVGISEEQKDLATPKIMMWGEQIIRNDALNPFFIEAYDVVFVTREGLKGSGQITDTLAYIPNAQLRAAEKVIKAAYEAKDYQAVYKFFDEAYKFTPINGKDWLALKAAGKN
ncbi:MAG: hypothetical protein RR354_04770 [Mucinivorans sp.]